MSHKEIVTLFTSEICEALDINIVKPTLVDELTMTIIDSVYLPHLFFDKTNKLLENNACKFDAILFSVHLAKLYHIPTSPQLEPHRIFCETLTLNIYKALFQLRKLGKDYDSFFSLRSDYYNENTFDDSGNLDTNKLLQSFITVILFDKMFNKPMKPDGSVPLIAFDDMAETIMQANAFFAGMNEILCSSFPDYKKKSSQENDIDKCFETSSTPKPDKKPPETSIEKYNPKSQKPYNVSLKNKYRYFNWYNIVFGSLILFCLVSVIVVLFQMCGNNSDTVSISQQYYTSDYNQVTTTQHEYVMHIEPKSGQLFLGKKLDPDYDDCSSLTIKASSDESCVVKLKDIYGDVWMSFYVRAGDKVTVGVPRETLRVFFASGDIWYGYNDLFGEYTSYSKDSSVCNFEEYTYEYTLYPVSSGNFSETPISADEF